MKKTLLLLFISILLIGCTSMKFNFALKSIGAFDDKIKLTKLTNQQKEVVFIPMAHIGTELFYKDVAQKLDSLQKIGFYVFFESVAVNRNDTMSMRKFRKFQGFPVPKKDKGYMYLIDSIYKIKLEKKLISQPSYTLLGVNPNSSRNVDVSFIDIINEYEKKYGEIILEDCDYSVPIYEKTNCKNDAINKKTKEELVLNFRNRNVVSQLVLDSHKKIAVIYGKSHFVGIKTQLLEMEFIEQQK